MSASPFLFTATNPLYAELSSSQKVIIRSSNAADTMDYTLVGEVAAVSTGETSALLGLRELKSSNTFDTITQLSLDSAAAGTVSVHELGEPGSASIIVTTNPIDGDTWEIGLTGVTEVYTFVNTLVAAYDILIGATESDTAENIRQAVWNGSAARGDNGGEGTLYGTGTAPHPIFEPTAISGQIVTLTDLLECARQLALVNTQSGSGLSLPSGLSCGTDGALVAFLAPGDTDSYNSFILDDEGLTLAILPALFTGRSDWMSVGGRPILQFRAANLTSPIELEYEYSNDQVNYLVGGTAIADLDNNVQHVDPTTEKHLESVRLNITANANTTGSSINAKILV